MNSMAGTQNPLKRVGRNFLNALERVFCPRPQIHLRTFALSTLSTSICPESGEAAARNRSRARQTIE